MRSIVATVLPFIAAASLSGLMFTATLVCAWRPGAHRASSKKQTAVPPTSGTAVLSYVFTCC